MKRMKVICIANTGDMLPVSYRTAGHLPTSKYDVQVNQVYTVYGICLVQQSISYLIDPDDKNRPNWYPAPLFNVQDSCLATTWHFSYTTPSVEDEVLAVWGYEELATRLEHFDELAERTGAALAVFAARKRELES
jgi:hypothetical protein